MRNEVSVGKEIAVDDERDHDPLFVAQTRKAYRGRLEQRREPTCSVGRLV